MIWSRLSLLAKVLIVANILLVSAVAAAGLITYRIARDAVREEIISAGTQSVQDFAKVNALDFLDEEKGKLDLQLKLRGLLGSDTQGRILEAYVLGTDGSVLAEVQGELGTAPPMEQLDTLERAEVLLDDSTSITIGSPVFYDDLRLGFVVFRYDGARIQRSGTQILYRAVVII
ncbi:MAG: hypothetical protein AAFY60_15710, partial [Myxococcota bacterium]